MIFNELKNKIAQLIFIEKPGTGISRIKEEVEKVDLPEVIFHYNYFFAVEFKRVKVGSNSENEGLNEGLKALIKIIAANPGIQAKEIAKLLSRPIKTIERQIKTLVEKKQDRATRKQENRRILD